MGIRDVLDLMPHLRDLERVDFADLLVVPLRTPLSQTSTTGLPVSAIRFTHDVIDSRAIFMHGDAGAEKPFDGRTSIYQTLHGL